MYIRLFKDMSRQPTLAHLGFKTSVDHRGQQKEVTLPLFVENPTKSLKCDVCGQAFVNQQGLTVHKKCIHESVGKAENSPHLEKKSSIDLSEREVQEERIEEMEQNPGTVWHQEFCL